MRQRLTDVAGACFRFCKKEPYSFGISVSSICIGVQDGLRQAYQQARQMMKYGFYDRDSILYYDCQKEVSRELPKSAEKLIHQGSESNREYRRRTGARGCDTYF